MTGAQPSNTSERAADCHGKCQMKTSKNDPTVVSFAKLPETMTNRRNFARNVVGGAAGALLLSACGSDGSIDVGDDEEFSDEGSLAAGTCTVYPRETEGP